jgi:hypothetical protein
MCLIDTNQSLKPHDCRISEYIVKSWWEGVKIKLHVKLKIKLTIFSYYFFLFFFFAIILLT